MKKSLTLAALSLCAASSVFAASDVPQEPKPTLYLSTYDMSGKTPTDLGKKDISNIKYKNTSHILLSLLSGLIWDTYLEENGKISIVSDPHKINECI